MEQDFVQVSPIKCLATFCAHRKVLFFFGRKLFVFVSCHCNDLRFPLRDIHFMNHTLHAETGYINFSPVGFKLAARDFRRCSDSFRPEKFSILPYSLYCRAIELGLKAIHLETDKQQEVKDEYGHNLVKSYEALPPERRTLSPTDTDLLAQINKLYVCKAFEYVQPGDAANAFSSFPDLEQLARLATNFASE
jgi:hypothetical protein